MFKNKLKFRNLVGKTLLVGITYYTKKAPRGEYRLHSTGEVVADPDFLSTWKLYKTNE